MPFVEETDGARAAKQVDAEEVHLLLWLLRLMLDLLL